MEDILYDPQKWGTYRITKATVRGGQHEYGWFGLPSAVPLRPRVGRRTDGSRVG